MDNNWMMMIQSQEFASKSPNRPPLGRLIIRKKDVFSLWGSWMSLKYTQHTNIPNAERNWMANSSHQSLKNPAQNYQACFGLFTPWKKWGLLLWIHRLWRDTGEPLEMPWNWGWSFIFVVDGVQLRKGGRFMDIDLCSWYSTDYRFGAETSQLSADFLRTS